MSAALGSPRSVVTRAAEIAYQSGPRGLLASLLAVGGLRRLILVEKRLEPGPATPPNGYELVSLSAADAAAFNPEWADGVAAARVDAGHRCVGLTDGSDVASALWVANGEAWIPYLGCSLVPPPGSVYIYDATTAPAFRETGLLTLAVLLYTERLRDEGVRLALAAALPENAPGYATAARAGFRPVATLFSAWGRGPIVSSSRAAHTLSRPSHMAPPLVSRVQRLRAPGEVVPAAWWGGVRPRRPLEPRGALRGAVLHHTAVPAAGLKGPRAEAEYMRAIERGHLLRGWWAIGYHYVVMPSGRVYEGRPAGLMGAHVRGHNQGTLGVALAGDFDRERPTAEALRALDRVLVPLSDIPLMAHRDLAETSCPGRHLDLARSRSVRVEALST